MSGFTHFLKTAFIPLFLAALLYLVLAYLLIPFIRRYRTRYSQYLPMPSDLPSTTPWRTGLSSALINLFVPTRWQANMRHRRVVDGSGGDENEEELFDDEEGEGMVGFDPISERRREALEQRRSMVGEVDRRLSRDLEEGFRDDSDESDEEERRRSVSQSRRAGY